jgi:CheY-like chemotaxis protein
VLGALDLLRQTPLDLRQRRLVKTAAASGESLMDILNDVLDHSKIEAGKLVLAETPMSLHALGGLGHGAVPRHAESRGLTITLQMGEGVPDGVVGDAPRLKQVLLNLIGNGVKFTEKGGVTLRLSSQPAGEKAARVRFEVQDTGIGIPAQAQQQVFQPFHQVDSTRSRLRGGTGLGLAISQRIVETMGGRIEVVQPARCRVGVRLHAAASRWRRNMPLPVHDSDFGSLDAGATCAGVVLLVEDNIVNRMIGAEMLKSFGIDVLEAEDGAQALTVLEQQHVDLVLMDIQMPVLDGYAATRQLRERENPPAPAAGADRGAHRQRLRRGRRTVDGRRHGRPPGQALFARLQLRELLQPAGSNQLGPGAGSAVRCKAAGGCAVRQDS